MTQEDVVDSLEKVSLLVNVLDHIHAEITNMSCKLDDEMVLDEDTWLNIIEHLHRQFERIEHSKKKLYDKLLDVLKATKPSYQEEL
jgi:hypothetical protein